MSKENVALVKGIYEAFAVGNVPGVLGKLSPEVVWHEAENFPYADRSPYIGPDAVAAGVFARIGADWNGFKVSMDELLDAGDTVVALGRYLGEAKATGKAMRAQVVHVWRIKSDKVTHFQQYVDTLQVARVTGAVAG